MPTALPENVQANDVGHINHTNTMHEARNRIVSVGRGVIYADANNGSDSNDGLSLAYAKQTLAGAIAAASNGSELRFMEGTYGESSVVAATGKKGLRLLGAGGITRDVQLGTRFVAQADGMTLLDFPSDGVIQKEGPEIANINFIDQTPSVRTATLLRLSNQNRWKLERCTFNDGSVGVRIEEDFGATGDDNAWNTSLSNVFTACLTGMDAPSGAGFRDYSSEFTRTGALSETPGVNALGGIHQSCKFFGTYFDGYGPGAFETNHVAFIGCKFENASSTLPGEPTLRIDGTGTFQSGNHNTIAFCSFAGYGTNTPSGAYIEVTSGARFAVIIGCDWVNSGTRVSDSGFKTINWNARDVAETYSVSNLTTDRAFNADTVTVSELADVVGTLINDLHDRGLIEM